MIVRVAENSFDHFRGNFQTGQFVRVIAVTGQVFRIKLRPDVKPGDLVRIPHGKRAFAKCATARQQARVAVSKNSCGRVVSCANGYYTVSLEGESTCKFRRSELQLLIEPCDSGPTDT